MIEYCELVVLAVCEQAALAEGLRTEEALTSRAALLAAAYPHKLLEVLHGCKCLTHSHKRTALCA